MTQPHPQPEYRECDGDCLSCNKDVYISCERRLNPGSYTHTPAAPATDETEIVKAITDAFDRGYAVAMADIEDMGKEKERDCIKRIKAEREQVLPIFISKAYTRIETVAPMDGIHNGWVLLADVKECLDSLRGGVT